MYGSFLRSVRDSRGMSQDVLADVSGVSQPNISAIENDRRLPTADTLNRLLVACGYELAATAGDRTIFCPLPRAGWFPDEDLPGRAPGDPVDEEPVVGADTPLEERVEIINALLEAASASVHARR